VVVRVKLKVEVGGRSFEVVAVANAGYESFTPQILLPRNMARRLGLWPPPRGAEELTYRTAGGPLRVWLLPRGARVSVVAEDKSSGEVECDVVISPLAGEALISDKLIDALGIVLEVPGRGLWRFRSDPPDKVRQSVQPK